MGYLYIRVFHLITRLNVGLRQITENVEHKKTPTYVVRNEASKTGGGRNCSFCGLLRTKVHLDKGWLFDMPEFYSDDAVRTENFFGNLCSYYKNVAIDFCLFMRNRRGKLLI